MADQTGPDCGAHASGIRSTELRSPDGPWFQRVRAELRRRDVPTREQLLDDPDVVAVLTQWRCERVAERMRRGPLGKATPTGGRLHDFLDDRVLQVVPPRWVSASM